MIRPYKIAILDYRMSNMFSIKNALDSLNFNCVITSNRSEILSADGAILPGVGSYPEAMKHISDLGLDETIIDFIATGKPFMGICLGFQLLFDSSTEIEVTSGLGIIPGEVTNFIKQPKSPVPHVGWNSIKKNETVNDTKSTNPLLNFSDGQHFYFVHSCFVVPEDKATILTTTQYGDSEFCSSIISENIFACQFHPEKSGVKGIQILNQMFNQQGGKLNVV